MHKFEINEQTAWSLSPLLDIQTAPDEGLHPMMHKFTLFSALLFSASLNKNAISPLPRPHIKAEPEGFPQGLEYMGQTNLELPSKPLHYHTDTSSIIISPVLN